MTAVVDTTTNGMTIRTRRLLDFIFSFPLFDRSLSHKSEIHSNMTGFLDTQAVERLCKRYGFTYQDGIVFNSTGRPLIFTGGDYLADDHMALTGYTCYGVTEKVTYGGKQWLRMGDHIYDHNEMYAQLLHETYGFGRFTEHQLKDIEAVFVLIADGCWFCESFTLPLYFSFDAEVTVCRPIWWIFEQFVRFETSKLPFSVTTVWDDDTISTRSDEFVEMGDVGPEYGFYPVDDEEDVDMLSAVGLTTEEFDRLMEDIATAETLVGLGED